MPPAYEVLLLNTAIPQIQAAQSGDTYVVPRDIAFNAGVTVGDASGDAFTINSSAVSTPNGLNFDSNTFVIDAANDRVGIGVASPVTKLHVEGSGTTSLFFVKNTSSFAGGTNFTQPHVTINSGDDTTGNVTRVAMSVGTGAQVYLDALMESGSTTYSSLLFRTRGADGVGERMRLNSSGNLGLGVTPSAWASGYRAIDISATGAITASNNTFDAWGNAFFNGTNTLYKSTQFATMYRQEVATGNHIWFNAPSGTAGNAITFTQAMTLDASGRLAIGATSVTNGTAFGGGSQVNVLKVESAGYPCVQVNTNTGGGGSLQFTNSGTVNGIIGYNASGAVNEFSITNVLSGPLVLATSNGEKARITSGGDVGIGTTSVYSQLDVRGSVTTQPTVSVDNRYFIFSDWLNKTAATTHTCKITFGSQANVYLNHTVEIIFAGSSTGSTTGYGGRAVYVVNAINAIQTATEVEDVGTGVSFAATFTGMELTITATTTANNNVIAFTARITSGISVDTARPVSMVVA